MSSAMIRSFSLILYMSVFVVRGFFIGVLPPPQPPSDWVFFDSFAPSDNDTDIACAQPLWRHGVRASECQTERDFLRLWRAHTRSLSLSLSVSPSVFTGNDTHSERERERESDAQTVSFRVVPLYNETDSLSLNRSEADAFYFYAQAEPELVGWSLERFADDNCSSVGLFAAETMPLTALDVCVPQSNVSLGLAAKEIGSLRLSVVMSGRESSMPTAFASQRAFSLLQTHVVLSISEMQNTKVLGEDSVREGLEKLVCNTLQIAPSYCECDRENCFSLAPEEEVVAKNTLRSHTRVDTHTSRTATDVRTDRGRGLVKEMDFYRLTATLNVTLNAVDFAQPHNTSAVLQEAQQRLNTMVGSQQWRTFTQEIVNRRFDLFYITSTLTGAPTVELMSVVAPPVQGLEEVFPSMAPTAADLKDIKNHNNIQKKFTLSQQIGVGVGATLLFLAHSVYLFFCVCNPNYDGVLDVKKVFQSVSFIRNNAVHVAVEDTPLATLV